MTSEDQAVQAPTIKFQLLGTEFKTFLGQEAIEGIDKDKLCALGLKYLTSSEGTEGNIVKRDF